MEGRGQFVRGETNRGFLHKASPAFQRTCSTPWHEESNVLLPMGHNNIITLVLVHFFSIIQTFLVINKKEKEKTHNFTAKVFEKYFYIYIYFFLISSKLKCDFTRRKNQFSKKEGKKLFFILQKAS